MTYWLAIGPLDNWKLGMQKGGVWGFTARYKSTWARLKSGDILIFYTMKPVKGIIGYGTIKSKEEEKKLFWPQEVKEGNVLWPLRIHFNIDFCIAYSKWETDKIPLPPLSQGITIQRALQEIKENVARDILDSFPKVKK